MDSFQTTSQVASKFFHHHADKNAFLRGIRKCYPGFFSWQDLIPTGQRNGHQIELNPSVRKDCKLYSAYKHNEGKSKEGVLFGRFGQVLGRGGPFPNWGPLFG